MFSCDCEDYAASGDGESIGSWAWLFDAVETVVEVVPSIVVVVARASAGEIEKLQTSCFLIGTLLWGEKLESCLFYQGRKNWGILSGKQDESCYW